MLNIFKLILGAKSDKDEYQKLQQRVEALPEDYRFVFKKMQQYMMNFAGGSGMDIVALCSGLVEMFEQGSADGRNVSDIIGDDPAGFCDELMRNADTWTDKLRRNLNGSINKKLRGE